MKTNMTVGISKELDSRKCRFFEIFCKHIYNPAGPQPTQPLPFYSVALFATDSFALLEVKHLKFCTFGSHVAGKSSMSESEAFNMSSLESTQSHLFGIADSFWAIFAAESPFLGCLGTGTWSLHHNLLRGPGILSIHGWVYVNVPYMHMLFTYVKIYGLCQHMVQPVFL